MTKLKQQQGAVVMFIIAWVIFMGMAIFLFGRSASHEKNPNQVVMTEKHHDQLMIRLRANRANHYVLNGKINQQSVVFLVDTGATDVVVPGKLADKLGLVRGHPMRARTASDIITVYFTVINSLQIGEIELSKVRASINPSMPGDEILLGMSALKNFDIIHRQGELEMRYRPNAN